MNCKKIIAKFLLLSSILVMNGCFSKTQATLSTEEWKQIDGIEARRHDKNLRKNVIDDVLKLKNPNSNIELYYWSILYKLECDNIDKKCRINPDEKEYKKEFFATLLYRVLSYKIEKNEIKNELIDSSLRETVKKFLNNKLNSYNSFKSLNEMDQINIGRICLLCSKHNLLNESELNGILENVGKFAVRTFNEKSANKKSVSPKLLIVLGTIPQNTEEELSALNALIEHFGGKDEKTKYTKTAENEQGREALIALGKIPGKHQKTTSVDCLNAVIDYFEKKYKDPIKIKQYTDALVAYAQINDADVNEKINVLEKLKKSTKNAIKNNVSRIASNIFHYEKNLNEEQKKKLNNIIRNQTTNNKFPFQSNKRPFDQHGNNFGSAKKCNSGTNGHGRRK